MGREREREGAGRDEGGGGRGIVGMRIEQYLLLFAHLETKYSLAKVVSPSWCCSTDVVVALDECFISTEVRG